MLLRLSIRDFVLVDHLELEFPSGFGALTGETGAGKSILVDALSLALGARTDASCVRVGAEKADIAAEFSLGEDSPLAQWLAENEWPTEGCLLLRRVIDRQGRSRAWINGVAATLNQLREAAGFLCDIHGQHAHHRLLDTEAQRALLDAQAGAEALVREVAARHAALRAARQALAAAERDREAMAHERELVAWQVQELEALAFDAEAWRETEAEQKRLAHAASLIETVTAALTLIEEGDGEREPALDALTEVSGRLSELAAIDGELGEPAELLAGALVQLEESALALRRYRERIDIDPERLAELDRRIEAVLEAARKHRVAPEELPEVLARLRARQEELSLAADPERLAETVAAAEAAYREAAQRLSQLRRVTAEQLSRAVSEAMQGLAMAGGRFEIALTPLPEGGAHGLENVEFLVAANPGQPLQSLSKVVSGGELARIGLALMVIASQARAVETMIFDEVDVGIGGRVAEIVGRLLHELGRRRQVLCVTHLPQVAACADWQWTVAKETHDGVTTSRITQLDREGRIEEIARMLGGMKITETTRRHARELLGL